MNMGGTARYSQRNASIDTKSGAFIAPSSDLTGAGGACVRVVSGAVDRAGLGPTIPV
jgi:hypothetical protein